MLTLHLKAPFAVFRNFNTGSFRPTADFITHSAAYGLLLNLAGIESRLDDGKSPMTLMRNDLPPITVAVGAAPVNSDAGAVAGLPSKGSMFQQLHNYPVGSSGKEHAAMTKGSKYNITPVRREFLTDFEAFLFVEAEELLESRILQGLLGELPEKRYGLPFLGDNGFLLDSIDPISDCPPVFWLCRVDRMVDLEQCELVFRLTHWINRADSSRTLSDLFVLTDSPKTNPPSDAKVTCPPR